VEGTAAARQATGLAGQGRQRRFATQEAACGSGVWWHLGREWSHVTGPAGRGSRKI
jgi:hypothetical protein